jgi:acyl carrier protein
LASSTSHPRLREKLFRVIHGSQGETIGELTETTSLIRSGLVDSTRLLELALFVEQEIGRPLDLSTVDLEREWDTVGAILRFIEMVQAGGGEVIRGS